jgi:microcystin-dependent protein
MAGTFPGVCNAQQHDMNGKPLAGAILTVFQGGTLTLASVFQDIGLIIPGKNPMEADDSGRLPLFFVDDGTYRVRLTDSTGVTTNGGFDYPQVPSIGPSAGGGGGTPVDPTTVSSTGDVKWQPIENVIAGWVRMNARTIGSATSGASERANADTQALFLFIWTNYPDAICPVVGGRGGTALADFNANKQITLLDMRGATPFGLDDMGNVAKGVFAGVPFGDGDATHAGSSGGEATHALAVGEMPAHTHVPQVTDPGHKHEQTVTNNVVGAFIGPLAEQNQGQGTPASTPAYDSSMAATGITVANADTGGNLAHNTMPPFVLGTWFWKL